MTRVRSTAAMAMRRVLALAFLLAGFNPWGPRVRAQEQLRDFTRPILVLNPGGHHAPIRALEFTPDGAQLLSGGLDKVVHIWRLPGGRPTLEATIRPPIWRGAAGSIYALALSPTADERGQRVLAVAGHGVSARRGNIGLFHFPGSNAITTGDHFAELANDAPDAPPPSGHADTVTSLAFDPTGRLLASASVDATARLWDWKNQRSTAVLRGHQGAINALAFTPDGAGLFTGGRDGVLRLWELARPAVPVATAAYPPLNPADPLGVQINALVVSRDGRWVVIGREDGRVIRYDTANLAASAVLLAPGGETVEALALSHDDARLVTATISSLRGSPASLPRLTCSVQLRRFPDGANPRVIRSLDNIAYACRFSPDDRVLAVAGGDAQAITLLTNLDNPEPAATTVKGQGRSIWDVGLAVDQGRIAVGYSHDTDQNHLLAGAGQGQGQGPRVSRRYYGMILPSRLLTSYDPAALSRAQVEYEGWSVRPVDQFHLDVVRANRPERTFRVTLDEVKDRRWKCYSFIPGGLDHPRPTLAVGCESGVWFYRLDDGRPTRLYAGHSGPVYCLAPSKDGRWLATGSSDQTVRLWTLAGCDVLPRLGAKLQRQGDGLVASDVEPLGFAEAMGLKNGDRAVKFALARQEVTADDFLARYEAQLPNTPIELLVQRAPDPDPGPPPGQAGAPPPAAPPREVALYTTKRNSPALSLFVGEDREWVLWMPSGYYDTSIAGDTKFLGWHINQGTPLLPRPSDYLEIIKFEKQLRMRRRSQPNKLDTLLATADLLLSQAVLGPLQARPEPVAVPPRRAEPRLDARPDAVARGGVPAPMPQPFPPVAIGAPASPSPVPAAARPPEPRPAEALAPVTPPPATVAPEAGANARAVAGTGPAPSPRPPDGASTAPLARNAPGAARLDARPPAPAGPEVKPPPPGPLAAVTQTPAPQPAASSPPTAPRTNRTAPGAAAGVEPPVTPLPDGTVPAPAPAPASGAIARDPALALSPVPGERTVQPGRTPAAALPIKPPVVQPLGALAARVPNAPALPIAPMAPPPAGPGPLGAPIVQPPPLEPAEFVERALPPSIEPRVQPLPNQQITTLDGKPIDPREVPPEKIAIGDLGPDGKATLVFDLMIDAAGRSPARSIDYRLDGRPVSASDRPVALRHEAVKLSLAPGTHRFTAEVENEEGIRRTISRDIFVRGVAPPRPARLKLLTIAPAYQETRIPPIRYAERDARDLRKFLAQHLVSPENGTALYPFDHEALEGASATAAQVKKSVEALKDPGLGEGDLVVVVIESHFLNVGSERRLVAADGMNIPPAPAIAADDLAANLGALAAHGCKVLVLLDGVHTASSSVWDTDISDWVRHLRDDHGVITFVASNSGPSQALPDQGHRAFAQGILDAIKPPLLRAGPYSLNDFRDTVVDRVLRRTERQQQAACYIPESISGQFLILTPR